MSRLLAQSGYVDPASHPPVQRPGVSQPKGAALDAEIQHLTQKLEKSGNLKDAAALLRARRVGTR